MGIRLNANVNHPGKVEMLEWKLQLRVQGNFNVEHAIENNPMMNLILCNKCDKLIFGDTGPKFVVGLQVTEM